MGSEKVKEIKDKLQEEVFIATSFGDKFRRVPTTDLQDFLTLINELESENENLKKDCADIANHYQEMGKFYFEETKKTNQLKDRIAELEKENARLNKLFTYDKSVCDRYFEFIKDIKEEALKQFAEKVKTKIKELKQRYHEDYIYGLGDEEYNGLTENNVDEILQEW